MRSTKLSGKPPEDIGQGFRTIIEAMVIMEALRKAHEQNLDVFISFRPKGSSEVTEEFRVIQSSNDGGMKDE